MQISKRLEAVAGMVTLGCRLMDVGTDHGYIPIYLVENGHIPSAIAGDINRGPLLKAEENIRLHGLEKKIETRLSDGLKAVRPGEAESITAAGMGGPLIVRILNEGRAVVDACSELILQPQSDICQVRVWLSQNSWRIVQEDMILEEGKFYPVVRAVKSDVLVKMTEIQLRFGPLLLENRHPVLLQFLQREKKLNEKIMKALAGKNGEASMNRRKEVEMELSLIGDAMKIV